MMPGQLLMVAAPTRSIPGTVSRNDVTNGKEGIRLMLGFCHQDDISAGQEWLK